VQCEQKENKRKAAEHDQGLKEKMVHLMKMLILWKSLGTSMPVVKRA
jgi:hypothetical protein